MLTTDYIRAVLATMKHTVCVGEDTLVGYWTMRSWCFSEFGNPVSMHTSITVKVDENARWYSDLGRDGRRFRFKDENDAILFKLKFGGSYAVA